MKLEPRREQMSPTIFKLVFNILCLLCPIVSCATNLQCPHELAAAIKSYKTQGVMLCVAECLDLLDPIKSTKRQKNCTFSRSSGMSTGLCSPQFYPNPSNNKFTLCIFPSIENANDKVHLRKLLLSKMCTHVSVGGLFRVKNGLLMPREEIADMLSDASQAAETAGVKLLASIGGWVGVAILSEDYGVFASNETTRTTFAAQVATTMSQRNLDGVVINWQNPGCRGMSCTSTYASEKGNMLKMLQVLKDELADDDKLIVVSLPAHADFLVGYDLPKLTPLVDFFQVLSFNYVYHGSPIVGNNAPFSNVRKTLENLVKLVKEPAKLLMGVNAHVEVYKLVDKKSVKIGAKQEMYKGFSSSYDQVCKRLSEAGEKVGEKTPANEEFCMTPYQDSHNKKPCRKVIDVKGSVVKRDPLQGNFIAVDDLWMSFEDKSSLSKKMELVNELGLGGLVVNAVHCADAENACGCGEFSFLRMAAELLSGDNGCDLPACI